MPTYLDRSLAQLKDFEGAISWMYRDTAGRVTVAVGLMLPYPDAACALPFLLADRAASHDEIAADYARVAAIPVGNTAAFYRHPASPELAAAEIDAQLRSVLTSFESGLRTRLAGYDHLPDPIKLALLDMTYNLGLGGLFHDYPKLLEAVEAGAWAQAAGECLRHGIGDARNAWTKAQFLSATVVKTIHAVADEPAWKQLLYGIIGWAATLLEH